MDDKQLMIDKHLKERGITNSRVLLAMSKVPRELFVAKGYESSAYTDAALPIGQGQTISQPYIVAFIAQSLNLKGDETVLDIGTGSGYAAAVFSQLTKEVISVERIVELANRAKEKLSIYSNVSVVVADATNPGFTNKKFDRIIVSAYSHEVPKHLFSLLKERGYLIAPVGDAKKQLLMLYKKIGDEITSQALSAVVFVPLVSDD